MSGACFLGIELLFLAATHLYGGPPWTLLGMVAFFAQIAVDFRLRPLALLVPSLAWLALFHATGNRELFFPIAMYLATYVDLLLAARNPGLGYLGGGTLVAAYMVIRVLQAASAKVLAVELVVAVSILALALVAHALIGRRPASDAVIVVLSSVAAFASLAL